MHTGTNNGFSSLFSGALMLTLTVSCSDKNPEAKTVSVSVITPAQTTSEARNYIIQADSVSKLRIGSPVTDVYEIFAHDRLRKQTYEEEGMPYKAIEVYHDTLSRPSLVLALDCSKEPCIVHRITITDSTYKTLYGIGIGSTYDELKNAHKTRYVGWGETGFMVVAADLPLTFVMDINAIGESSAGKLSATTLPDSTRIKSMFMFNPNLQAD